MSAGGDRAESWLDDRGCLTPAALSTLRQAPPGRAPEAIARHLVGCRRCQERLLAGASPPVRRREAAALSARSRRLWWGAALALAVLLLLALFALVVAGRAPRARAAEPGERRPHSVLSSDFRNSIRTCWSSVQSRRSRASSTTKA